LHTPSLTHNPQPPARKSIRPPPTAVLAAEPYRIFDNLLIEDLQELADDIRGFKVGVK